MTSGTFCLIKQGVAFREFGPLIYGETGIVMMEELRDQRFVVKFKFQSGPMKLGLCLRNTDMTFFVPHKGKMEW